MPIRFHLATAPFLVTAFAVGIANAGNLKTARLSCDVANTQETTVLTARVKGIDDSVRFRINWLSGEVAPANFRNLTENNTRISSSHRIGKITVTRTILASAEADCILIHVIADQPGEVAFQASFLSDAPAQTLGRRELVLPGGKVHAHAWIIPFESDVGDDGKGTITVSGEGEALILLNLTANTEKQPIVDTWIRLGARHDPGSTPPDPHLVWEALSKETKNEREK